MYVIGRNENGEFGLNHKDIVKKLTKHKNYKIKNIICGNNYNIYIDINDNFWAAGKNEWGSCIYWQI